VSIGEGKYLVLARPWSGEEGVTIPAGTAIWVTPDKERELREGGFITEPADQPGEEPPSFFEGVPTTGGPPEDDPEFLDVHDTVPTYLMPP
jgi:hypothetical protein